MSVQLYLPNLSLSAYLNIIHHWSCREAGRMGIKAKVAPKRAPKTKVSKKVIKKKPANKAVFEKARKESKADYIKRMVAAVEDYCKDRPEEYVLDVKYEAPVCMFIHKKIHRMIKIINNRNPCMVFERDEPECFVVPVIVLFEPCDYPSIEKLKDFGFKSIIIKELDDIERKLESIN